MSNWSRHGLPAHKQSSCPRCLWYIVIHTVVLSPPSLTATPTPSPLADPLRDELLSSKPTAVLLLKKVIPSVAHKWHQLGFHLGMDAAILKTFKVTESHDVKLCCLEMFECWLEGSRGAGESPRTWSSVLSAVGDCLGRDVADSIERALLERRRQRK